LATPSTTPLRALLVPLFAAAAVLGVLPVSVGSAEPRPSLHEVERRVNALDAQADDIVEAYSESKLALRDAKRKAALAQGRVRAARAQLDAVQKSMYGVAAAAYRSGGTDAFVQLVSTSTPQTFLDRAASLNRIASGQSAQLAAANTARHRLSVADAEAKRQSDARKKVELRLSEQKSKIESLLGEQRRLLSSLRADERRRLEASRRAAAERASRSRASSGSYPSYNGPASGRAAVAVQEAYRKLGSPYQWGASGPNRFDCSGLTMWAWGKAGVSLPHSSRAQYSGGRKVSRGNLRAGDLVYYGSPIHHVGIYIGGGRMISAPHSGDVVKIQNAFRSDYAGATRP
jgi:peptidoglycan DL-endopeptidase CwlO